MEEILEALFEWLSERMRLLGRLAWSFLELLLRVPDLAMFLFELLTSDEDKKQQWRTRREARRARRQERRQGGLKAGCHGRGSSAAWRTGLLPLIVRLGP